MRRLLAACLFLPGSVAAQDLRVGVFDVDASPPVGSPLAYDPTEGIESRLSCRGIVIVGADAPIVLVAVDWIGIANGGQTIFKEAIARAAKSDPIRVVVHALHQHDAPRCDFSADEILADAGLPGIGFDAAFARNVAQQTARAVAAAITQATPVTHVAFGSASVEQVASNRRILGPDGKVKHTRWTATRDPAIRAFPAGTIDPELRLIAFWNQDTPVAVLSYYACHPQSYYRTKMANPDFPGIARNMRQADTGVPHIHFNGAGGNIGAGKWNDGDPGNRQVLADRVAVGMKRAWQSAKRQPISAADVDWTSTPVRLPPAPHLQEETLVQSVTDESAAPATRWAAATNLAWLRRCHTGDTIDITCLHLKSARVLHMPGELFVEYQLAAQAMRPKSFVAMAAYGDYAPGYIGTQIAYSQGGYETSPRASRVAPEVETVLLQAMERLLRDDR